MYVYYTKISRKYDKKIVCVIIKEKYNKNIKNSDEEKNHDRAFNEIQRLNYLNDIQHSRNSSKIITKNTERSDYFLKI